MLKKDSFLRMADVREKWCVSVYMPIDPSDTQKNRISLKNLMFDAERKLLALEVTPQNTARMLAPIEMILNSSGFWEDRKEGFAAFFTKDSFVWHSMSYKFDQLAVVTDRFHLKPLLRNASKTRRFHLLTLSQNQIKFYEASEDGINEVYVKGLPRNPAAALNSEDDEKELQMDSGGEDSVKLHGNVSAEEDKKGKLTELFRKVDKAVVNYLKDQESPLLLAATAYLHPIYHEVNTYHHILKEGLTGNVDTLTPKELLEFSLRLVKPAFREEREKAMEIFREKLGIGLASDNFPEIFQAAKNGRIETLFVPVGKQKWGQFDNETNEVQINRTAKPGDKDLLCVASNRTLKTGGTVFVVLPEQMPNNSSIAAILRY